MLLETAGPTKGTVMRRFVLAVLVMGFVLNLTGWAGNVFLLGSM
jgi:hypothetical protein